MEKKLLCSLYYKTQLKLIAVGISEVLFYRHHLYRRRRRHRRRRCYD